MLTMIQALGDRPSFDVAVIGAGGAGLSAAVMAAADGARVLLVESTEFLGGTTAYSAATTWIAGSHLAAGVNPQDSVANAATFLDHAVGDRAEPALRQAFLQHGAAAVAKIEACSHLRYRARPLHPDYLSELPSATLCGRALEPLPFDGRLLGDDLALLRPPIPEFTVLGGMAVDRDDIFHLLRVTTSLTSFKYVLRILARHAADRLRYPRGTRLLMGNALIARLMLSARERGITVMTRTQVTALHREGNAITGLTLQQGGVSKPVSVKGGILLATGGFNRHPAKRAERLPGIAPEWCPGAPGHTGSLHTLAEAVGAHYAKPGLSDCFWAPVSLRKRSDGSTAAFPHFVFDRAKPGMVTVNQAGRRFVNESTSYHLFGLAMLAAHQQSPSIPAYLITDAQGLRKYGLGMVRPGGRGLTPYLADGYLTSAPTLDGLAQKLGIDAAGLRDTVARMNVYAQTGVDEDFQRGTTAYQRANGDAAWTGPNPSLGPIATAPYYAVRLVPGDIGASTGFATDTEARMLDAHGQPIAGLYAVGNDAQSVMGGVYPGPGITIGPGLTFAYLAARHAVARATR